MFVYYFILKCNFEILKTYLNNFFGKNPVDVLKPGCVGIVFRKVFDFHWIVKSEKLINIKSMLRIVTCKVTLVSI